MENYKSIFLLKLPYCAHPSAVKSDDDFRKKGTFGPVPSLALAALCGFIDKYKSYDYSLKAIDLNIEGYTAPSESIDLSCYPKLLADAIKNHKYDVLALSTMLVSNVRWVGEAVALSRKHHPEAKIIIGGGYPTIFPSKCLDKYDVDFIVMGEGEAAFLHILNTINIHSDDEFEKKFRFESYGNKNEQGEIYISPERNGFMDMKDVPPPAWNYLDIEKYFKKSGNKSLPFEASRGCPYSCAYCSTNTFWGRKVRHKPVDNLTNEILKVNELYNGPTIYFVDDNMDFNKKWFKEFFKKLISVEEDLKIDTQNFSVRHLDEETIDLLIKIGINRINIAVETGSEEMQKQIRKYLKFDQVREVVKTLQNKKMHYNINWMLGFPGETMDQIKDTLNLARELKADLNSFYRVLPYPGTRLYEDALSNNLLTFNEDNLDTFEYKQSDYIKSDEWSYELLQELIYDANIEMNFLSCPALDSEEGMEYFRDFLENLVLRLPGHIIAHIVLGYIYKCRDNEEHQGRNYNAAISCLKDEQLNNTFAKYLSWDHKIIDNFNAYLETKRVTTND